uniref:Endoplasmic reticulum vesicle transporter C-terminal domain-containing protein n=1 Tax=Phytophthora ramorum TaxID=164328 RepID=H3HEH4_PHYRM
MRQRAVKSDVDDGGLGDNANESAVSRSARRVLKKVDVYPKMHREFKVQTEFGATISVVAGLVMAVLFLSELSAYWSLNTHEHMVVDSSLSEKLQVNLDVSFLAVNCRDAHINAMDVAGELQVNMHQTVIKTRLDANGDAIGRPTSMLTDELQHPAGKDCCNSCEEVKEAFIHSDLSLEEAEQKEQCMREIVEEEKLAQDGEGCRFTGKMFVNRVAGNFHVALGRTFHRQGRLVHQFRPGQEHTYNSSHIIHSLSFGEPMPGVDGPLNGVSKITAQSGGVFQYYIKIVPTIYSDIDENAIHSYKFGVTQQGNYMNPRGQMTSLPGTFFVFDLSPFMVKVENDRVPFTHFLTKICAIVGGVISIAGFVDSFMYNSLHVRLFIMGDEDVRNAAERLRKLLRVAKYPQLGALRLEAGDVSDLLRVLHFVLLDSSRQVAQFLVDKGYDLFGKTDARFVESAFRLLRDEFRCFPSLSVTQFLSRQFVARRLAIVADAAAAVAHKRQELQRRKRREEAVWSQPQEGGRRQESKPLAVQFASESGWSATEDKHGEDKHGVDDAVQTEGAPPQPKSYHDSDNLVKAIGDLSRQLSEVSSTLLSKISSVENRLGRLEDQIHDVQVAVVNSGYD